MWDVVWTQQVIERHLVLVLRALCLLEENVFEEWFYSSRWAVTGWEAQMIRCVWDEDVHGSITPESCQVLDLDDVEELVLWDVCIAWFMCWMCETLQIGLSTWWLNVSVCSLLCVQVWESTHHLTHILLTAPLLGLNKRGEGIQTQANVNESQKSLIHSQVLLFPLQLSADSSSSSVCKAESDRKCVWVCVCGCWPCGGCQCSNANSVRLADHFARETFH